MLYVHHASRKNQRTTRTRLYLADPGTPCTVRASVDFAQHINWIPGVSAAVQEITSRYMHSRSASEIVHHVQDSSTNPRCVILIVRAVPCVLPEAVASLSSSYLSLVVNEGGGIHDE